MTSCPPLRRDPGRRAEQRWWLVACLVLVFLAIIFIYPTGLMLSRPVTSFDPPQQGGLDNLTCFLRGEANRTILIRTFVVALLVTVITALLAVPLRLPDDVVAARR